MRFSPFRRGFKAVQTSVFFATLSATFGKNERTDNMAITIGHAIGVAMSLVLIVAIAATAHYLQQIRDTLREMQRTQKALATRLGAKV